MKEKHTSTILVFVFVLTILFVVYRNVNLLYAALVLSAIGIFVPWLSRKIHWAWMKFGELLGSVMNKVLLSIVFYIFLVPVAIVSGFFRKSPFTSRNNKSGSYFTDRNVTYTAASLEHPW